MGSVIGSPSKDKRTRSASEIARSDSDVVTTLQYIDVQLGDKIAEGGQGVVYKGKYNGKDVAVKYYELGSQFPDVAEKIAKDLRREVSIMTTCYHSHVVRALGTTAVRPKIDGKTFEAALVLEYFNGQSLSHIYGPEDERTKAAKDFTIGDCLGALFHVGKGILYLHDCKIIHRDIKPGNILLEFDASGRFVRGAIADFGISKYNDPNEKQTRYRGTGKYRAPEVSSANYDHRVDIYSLGFVILRCVVEGGHTPGIDKGVLMSNRVLAGLGKLKDCAILCLSDDPKARPTLIAVLQRLEKDYIRLASKPRI
jgi:serine/threonine protein kinase